MKNCIAQGNTQVMKNTQLRVNLRDFSFTNPQIRTESIIFWQTSMFVLSELEDIVKIIPNDFKKEKINAITDVLNEKYANKVVQDIGHCICVHDILNVSEGFILYLDGCSYVKGIASK